MLASAFPKWVVLQLVEACNLRCSMCYEWGEHGTYHHQGAACLDFDVVRRVVQDCLPGKPFFELFGGEPFLHPRIADVIELIGKSGCRLGIPTNGTLLRPFSDVLVGAAPIRLWVSIDGPEAVNDRQRGAGSFRRAVDGIGDLYATRCDRACAYPQLGVTYIVTPLNCAHLERFILESIDLSMLDFVSVVLQNYATEEECAAFELLVRREFGGVSATFARGFVRDVSDFSKIDIRGLSEQIIRVRDVCREKGVLFFSNPMTTDAINLGHYFNARWLEMADRRTRCAFPWMCAEVSARGEVATCHALYDITVGSVHTSGILDIWNGEQIQRVRDHLRGGLFPICTACCRYYNNPTSAVLDGLETTRTASSFSGEPASRSIAGPEAVDL